MDDLLKENEKIAGYIKYEGISVNDGFFDARKSSEALLGLDESLRYFINKEGVNNDFDIPVRIQKGSWIALIATAGLSIIATGYLTSAVSTIAKNDFKDVTTKDLFNSALKKIQTVVDITKHSNTRIKSEIKAKVIDYKNQIIGVTNSAGEVLKITKDEFDAFLECPENLLNKLASNVNENISLKIGRIDKDKIIETEIKSDEKYLFYVDQDDNDEEDLFPELRDGDIVELEGKITKGNEKTNYIGLEYKGHILNCKPENGGVKQYKPSLFTKAVVRGIVHRIIKEKKPQLIIMSIKILEEELSKQTLFKI